MVIRHYYRVHYIGFYCRMTMVILVIRSRNSSIYWFSRASLVNLFTVTDAFFIEIFSHHTYNIIIIYTHVYLYDLLLHAYVIIIIFQWRFASIYTAFSKAPVGDYSTRRYYNLWTLFAAVCFICGLQINDRLARLAETSTYIMYGGTFIYI